MGRNSFRNLMDEQLRCTNCLVFLEDSVGGLICPACHSKFIEKDDGIVVPISGPAVPVALSNGKDLGQNESSGNQKS